MLPTLVSVWLVQLQTHPNRIFRLQTTRFGGFFVDFAHNCVILVKYIMQVSKITEVTIFESPDGGRTVYARKPGTTHRELHYQDPNLQQELKELESQKRWVDIFQARRDNVELDHLCEQVEILYELGRPQP